MLSENANLDDFRGSFGFLECFEDAGGVVIVLHLPVIAKWTGSDLGDAQLALLDLLLAFFATRLRKFLINSAQ